ncbi:Beta-xylosidase [Pseudobythopirellula maris]|uniref:Beta-xylosidase n=2 Tax=Pseudobythopirellula maris TaxID=2527991 RepID=A0A5C5ZQI0_9BACT|nr:Beta-xylosidase [Pseudobythopirellula maris]
MDGVWRGGAASAFEVEIAIDATEPIGPLRPIWRFFGADEPNYVYMKDGEKLMEKLGGMRPGEVFFRAHNLLTSGDKTPALKWGSTNAYTEDENGDPVYDWEVIDLMFDTMLERGVRPYVEVGFMPEALSRKPTPYRHDWRPGMRYSRIMTGWRHPPKDYGKWEELVYQLALHCVERYGMDEVRGWYWETWNEANILPDGYWGGTREEFFRLHDHTIAAVRRAIPDAIVGGPDSAGDGGDFTRAFLEHCLRGDNAATGETGVPIDFIAFHAKGAPTHEQGHVRMGIANQLRTIDRGFGIVASFPELKRTPIVIGESDPEGCAACQGPMFSYRNGTVYSSYTAASFARKHELADKHGVRLEGALTWAFEFEDQPYFAGFRQLATNAVPLPVLNVLRMMARMSGERLASTSSSQVALDAILRDGVRGEPDVGVLASRDGGTVWALVWHYHDDDVYGPDAEVTLRLTGWGESDAAVTHHRVDEDHSNSYAEWKRMGSPGAPNEKQYGELMEASELATVEQGAERGEGALTLRFDLPRQGVSLLEISPN